VSSWDQPTPSRNAENDNVEDNGENEYQNSTTQEELITLNKFVVQFNI